MLLKFVRRRTCFKKLEGLAVADGCHVLALILAGGVTARAGTDVFMRAVGFALTGRDYADPKVNGDGAKCVFAINNDIFRLSNVYTDRIAIQGYARITWRRCRV